MGRNSTAKQRILDSAQDLIVARSYADVGVQEICHVAGVKKGSFYHFFPSKCDLALDVLDQLWYQFETDILIPAFQKDIPALERFSRFQQLAYEFQKRRKESSGQLLGCPYGNLAAEMSTQNESIRLKVKEIFKRMAACFESNLQEAVDQGTLVCEDVRLTSRSLLAYLEGIIMLAKAENNPEIMKSFERQFFKLII